MANFLASLVVSVLLTIYIIITGHIISLASSISWWFGLVVFIITLAVAIDFLTQVGKKK